MIYTFKLGGYMADTSSQAANEENKGLIFSDGLTF